MPKARERFAEFLDQDSLDRFGILYLTTSVGLGYGRHKPSRRSFSRQHGITGFAPNGAHHRTSPSRPPDLPGGRAACLTTENHLRGRLPSCVTPALTYYKDRSQHHHASPSRRKGKPGGGG